MASGPMFSRNHYWKAEQVITAFFTRHHIRHIGDLSGQTLNDLYDALGWESGLPENVESVKKENLIRWIRKNMSMYQYDPTKNPTGSYTFSHIAMIEEGRRLRALASGGNGENVTSGLASTPPCGSSLSTPAGRTANDSSTVATPHWITDVEIDSSPEPDAMKQDPVDQTLTGSSPAFGSPPGTPAPRSEVHSEDPVSGETMTRFTEEASIFMPSPAVMPPLEDVLQAQLAAAQADFLHGRFAAAAEGFVTCASLARTADTIARSQ